MSNKVHLPFEDVLGLVLTPIGPAPAIGDGEVIVTSGSVPRTPNAAKPPTRLAQDTRRKVARALEAAGGEIRDHGGSATQVLAEQAGLPWPSQSLTALLRVMEADKEVERDVDHTRTWAIRLTETGREKFLPEEAQRAAAKERHPAAAEDSDWWRMTCAVCTFTETDIASHGEAVAIGNKHASERHPEEWAFRVQGFKRD